MADSRSLTLLPSMSAAEVFCFIAPIALSEDALSCEGHKQPSYFDDSGLFLKIPGKQMRKLSSSIGQDDRIAMIQCAMAYQALEIRDEVLGDAYSAGRG